MSKRYPADEFDSVPEASKREGTHREWVAYTGPGKRLRPLLIMGLLVLVVGVVMYTLVRPWSSNAFGEAPGQIPSESVQSAPAPKPSQSQAGAKESAESSNAKSKVSTAPSASSSASASKSAPAKSAKPSTDPARLNVGIYNATPVTGAAQKATDKLKSKGYKPTASGNWTRMEQSSTVYYKDSKDGDAAAKLAHELGIGGTYQIDSIPQDITVVIGHDIQAQ